MSQKKPVVLIVEDEMIVAAFLQVFLQRSGFEVPEIAATGEQAVAVAKASRPDVVLMDIHLAGVMNGLQAADRIAADRPGRFIFVSAHAHQYKEHRITGSLTVALDKPFDEQQLIQTVHHMLEQPLPAANGTVSA